MNPSGQEARYPTSKRDSYPTRHDTVATASAANGRNKPGPARQYDPVRVERLNQPLLGVWFTVPILAFVVMAGFVASRHEMWSDELYIWGMARASATPVELIHNLRYDSTPPLWHLCLYMITRFTGDPRWMQVLQVALAAAAAAVFLRFAPFNRIIKIMFIFGYFPFYEYGVISRHYVLGELFLFVFLALYPWRGWRAVCAGLAIFLISQTSFFGFVMALACMLALVVFHRGKATLSPSNRPLMGGLAVAAVGLGIALWMVRQHPDSSVHRAWDFINEWHALQTGTVPWRTLVAIPSPRLHFWNTNILDSFEDLETAHDLPSLLTQDALSLCILGATFIALRKRPAPLALFATITLACLAFFYVKKLGYIRHQGHFFLAWVGAAWLVMAGTINRREERLWSLSLSLVFGAAVIGSLVACTIDVRHRFSAGAEVAKWIVANGHQDDTIVAKMEVAAYLDRDVYLMQNDRFGRFLFFRRPWRKYKPDALSRRCDELEASTGRPCVVAVPLEFFSEDGRPQTLKGFREVARWDDCIAYWDNTIIFVRDR